MALFTKLSNNTINALATAFGLEKPVKTKGIVEGTVNTYYRLTYPHKNYYLKIDEVAEKTRLLNEIKIFKLLGRIAKKLPFQTPVPLKTTKGSFYVPYQKKFALIFDEVFGKSPVSLNEKQLGDLGQKLGLLHKLTIGQKLPPHRFNLKGQQKVFQQIQKKLNQKHPHIFKFTREKLASLKKNEPKKIPQGLIHADIFPENTFYQGNKMLGLIDFEAAGQGAFLFDIGVCIHALCHKKTILSPALVRAFLKGYQKKRKLSPLEKQYFAYYLEQSAMRFLLTRLRDFELKNGKVAASPFKDYREYVERFEQIAGLVKKLKFS
ncbi:homoserine kinase [bacterium]|nr:homoserine kinase [bacterium]